jgi:hypothetical protein
MHAIVRLKEKLDLLLMLSINGHVVLASPGCLRVSFVNS